MKNIIAVLFAIMIVGLFIGLFIYQNQVWNTLPQANQPNDREENTKTPNEMESTRPIALQPIDIKPISYTLQNNELNITFNKGNVWVRVPIEKDWLFEGEYSGNKLELIDGSYILTKNRAAFLFSEGSKWGASRIGLKYSIDQGKTWQDGIITESFPFLRFRKVAFLNEQFGYVILSGDRTMSQEYSKAFLTFDGGKTWRETTDSGNTRLIADGGFIDETTGFMSYGTINPEAPDLYVTQDGGNSWSQAVINVPEKYDRIFVQAEVPGKEGDHLSVLVNQGPSGDYLGGKVKGKFISKDNGKTWDFLMEVQPNEPK